MLTNFKEIVINMLEFTWPMIVISTVIVVSLRITDLIIKKEKLVLYKELLKLLFIIYILCLFQIVTYQDVNFGDANFIPFKEMFRYNFGSYSFLKNILGNMLLFLPFGLFAGYFIKVKKASSIIVISLIASISIEATQLVIGRVFDVDDIILNILGALVGFIGCKLFYKFNDIIPNFFKKEWVLNVLTIGFIILIVRLLII